MIPPTVVLPYLAIGAVFAGLTAYKAGFVDIQGMIMITVLWPPFVLLAFFEVWYGTIK